MRITDGPGIQTCGTNFAGTGIRGILISELKEKVELTMVGDYRIFVITSM